MCGLTGSLDSRHLEMRRTLLSLILVFSFACGSPCKVYRVTGCRFTPPHSVYEPIIAGKIQIPHWRTVPGAWALTLDGRFWGSQPSTREECEREGRLLRWEFCYRGNCKFVDRPPTECSDSP